MTLTLGAITFDSREPEPLAAWWAERFGARIDATNDGFFVTVSGGALPCGLAFQRVDDPTPGKNRLHLDVMASGDLDEQAAELVAAGAVLVGKRAIGDFEWITLEDPDGNEFCLAGQH